LFDTGRIVNATETFKDQQRHGPGAAESIAVKGKEKDNAVSVYRLSAEVTQLLANLFTSEPLYKDLGNDLTGLDKLIAKLQNEKHTGSVQVQWTKSKDAATILMREGQVLECAWLAKGAIVSGAATLDQIIKATAGAPVSFTVYRTELTRVYSADLDLADSFARPTVLALWQNVLNLIEGVIDRWAKPGTFNAALRRACIAQATTYPFLDPFVAEFEYRDSQVKFEGQATIARFNTGLSECVAQTVRDLEAQAATQGILAQLQTAAANLRAEQPFQLEQIGLTATLPEVFKA
ncbi:MAG: hypothetical protein L0Y55_14245, partial [Anaerolineales bacterium]|nr:hypothetical protein [Anaerolineales bacterium]